MLQSMGSLRVGCNDKKKKMHNSLQVSRYRLKVYVENKKSNSEPSSTTEAPQLGPGAMSKDQAHVQRKPVKPGSTGSMCSLGFFHCP